LSIRVNYPMTSSDMLVFVYNADGGLFDALSDAAHKALSPSTYACSLCKLTYGLLTEKRAWREFIQSLPVRCEFLHRDAFQRHYAEQHWPAQQCPLPAVLRIPPDGTPRVCIQADALNRCQDLPALMALVRTHCIGDCPDAR
jgi:hypothetical protein